MKVNFDGAAVFDAGVPWFHRIFARGFPAPAILGTTRRSGPKRKQKAQRGPARFETALEKRASTRPSGLPAIRGASTTCRWFARCRAARPKAEQDAGRWVGAAPA